MTTAPTATTFFIEAAGKPTSNVAPKRGGQFWTPIQGQYSKPVDSQQERNSVYQRYLFAPEADVDVSFDDAFVFKDGMYWDQGRYRGRWKPRKHFLGPDDVPTFDGAGNGEEIQCAQTIDSLPVIRFWIRNVARHPNSFWLPTATDKFYPDFVAQMDDGRLLVVEYKGAHLADGLDTAEKRTIGQLWEKTSGGKGVFIVVEKTVEGKDMRAQMIDKIGTN